MNEYSTFDCPFDFRSLVLRIRCATTFLFTCYAPQHDAKRPTKIATILQAACGTAHSSRCHLGALMPTPAASLTLPQRSGSIRRCVSTYVCVSPFVYMDGLAVEKRSRPPFGRPLACVLTACIRNGVAGRRVCDARTGQDAYPLPVAERGVGRHGLRRCVLRVPLKPPCIHHIGGQTLTDANTDTHTGTHAHAYTRPQATSPVSPTPDTPAWSSRGAAAPRSQRCRHRSNKLHRHRHRPSQLLHNCRHVPVTHKQTDLSDLPLPCYKPLTSGQEGLRD